MKEDDALALLVTEFRARAYRGNAHQRRIKRRQDERFFAAIERRHAIYEKCRARIIEGDRAAMQEAIQAWISEQVALQFAGPLMVPLIQFEGRQ